VYEARQAKQSLQRSVSRLLADSDLVQFASDSDSDADVATMVRERQAANAQKAGLS
jgi:hypothetical protein